MADSSPCDDNLLLLVCYRLLERLGFLVAGSEAAVFGVGAEATGPDSMPLLLHIRQDGASAGARREGIEGFRSVIRKCLSGGGKDATVHLGDGVYCIVVFLRLHSRIRGAMTFITRAEAAAEVRQRLHLLSWQHPDPDSGTGQVPS